MSQPLRRMALVPGCWAQDPAGRHRHAPEGTSMIRIQLSVRNLLVIAGVLVGLWVLAKVWSVVLLAGVGLLLAAALLPFVEWLRQRIHNRAAAVLVVVLLVLAALALITFIVVPPMVAQGQQLWEQAPELQ